MVSFNSVSAAIHVDGQPLQEFQTETKGAEKTVSCWIPSCVGKEFTIHIQNTTRSNVMLLNVDMDGVHTNARRIYPGREQAVDKCRPSPTTFQYFAFSQGQLVDDDELPLQSSSVAGLGTIMITVFYCKVIKTKNKVPYSAYRNIDIPEQRSIPEREKKGVQECIGLGRIERRVPDTRLHHDYAQRLGIAAKFVFRYRPTAYLEAQGIAPSTRPVQQGFTANSNKRKETHNAESSARPFKVSKTSAKHKEAGQLLDISDEEDVEQLTALRARIDRALEKKGVQTTQVKREVKAEPRNALLGTEIIDLT